MTCTRPQAESQKNPLTRGRRPHMTHNSLAVRKPATVQNDSSKAHSKPSFFKLRLHYMPSTIEKAVAGDIARLLVILPIVQRLAFVCPLLTSIISCDD